MYIDTRCKENLLIIMQWLLFWTADRTEQEGEKEQIERSRAHAQTQYFPAVWSNFLVMFQTLSGVFRKHIGTARVNPLGIFRRNMGSLSNENRSIHSDNIQDVHNIPMDVIIRPIPPVLDEQKVQSLMTSIKVRRIRIDYWLHLTFKYAYSVCDSIWARRR